MTRGPKFDQTAHAVRCVQRSRLADRGNLFAMKLYQSPDQISIHSNVAHSLRALPLSQNVQRTAVVSWIVASSCTVALTLNPNRQLGLAPELAVLREAFADADREVLGHRYNKVDARKRLLAFILPEHVGSNLHFHLACRPGETGAGLRGAEHVESFVSHWKSRVPSGTSELKVISDLRGWARYMTKDQWRNEADFQCSALWWPARQRHHERAIWWTDPLCH